ncbi:MAG TPA: SulP family inorganic anion transporter [Myxococcota bacterium]|nr:SulP family inorganic anion transporter [Myxococcota bacterium]
MTDSEPLVFRVAPGLRKLRDYRIQWLRGDLVAGLTLAAYLVPSGIGDASLAGLPPEAGLYACLFGGLVFWLFCSGQQTIVTVTSAISLLVGTSLGALSQGDAARYAALAAATAGLVAALALCAWALRAGSVVNFISETVLVGFKSGVALVLAISQLPKLCGIHGSHGNFWQRCADFVRHLGESNPTSVALGLGALALLIAGKRWLPNRPVSLVVLVAGIACVPWLGLEARGVELLGAVPQGLPRLGLPAVHAQDWNALLPLAMACFLLGAVETTAIGRTFAAKHRYRLDANQEFLALSASNLGAALGRGFPISGGMSQSLVNESGGAKTPLSGLVAALLVMLVALFLSGLLHDLPKPVLAAIVLVAVAGLFKISAWRELWHFSRAEAAIAFAALLGVLGSGLLRGVLIGAVISLVLLLRRGAVPYTTELGHVAGTDYWADAVRHPENERLPDVFVFRCDASLLYFNVEHVRDRFFELLAERSEGIRLAVFFLGTVPMVDLAGAALLEELHHALGERGIALRLAEARGNVRETLRRSGFAELARIEENQPVSRVVAEWREPLSSGADSAGSSGASAPSHRGAARGAPRA